MSFGNGVNLQPSYYNGGDVDFAWELMKKTNIKTLRIEIEGHMATEARGWIQQACVRGYTVIATYHSKDVLETQKKTNSEEVSDLMEAARWWVENLQSLRSAPVSHCVKAGETLDSVARKYYDDPAKAVRILEANRSMLCPDSPTPKLITPKLGFRRPRPVRAAGQNLPATAPHLLDPDQSLNILHPGQFLTIPTPSRSFSINLMNEWGSHNLTAQGYAKAYNAAIKTVRKVYTAGPIIIDLSGSGQETAVAASAAKGSDGAEKISDIDTIFSVHIYGNAWVQQKCGASKKREGWLDTADLDDLWSARRPCMIGEFGLGEEKGGADWPKLVSHAKNLHWPVLGWAWNGDGGIMNMISPPWNYAPKSCIPQSACTGNNRMSDYFESIKALL